jgi:outer membrane protein assembly factor BamB
LEVGYKASLCLFVAGVILVVGVGYANGVIHVGAWDNGFNTVNASTGDQLWHYVTRSDPSTEL